MPRTPARTQTPASCSPARDSDSRTAAGRLHTHARARTRMHARTDARARARARRPCSWSRRRRRSCSNSLERLFMVLRRPSSWCRRRRRSCSTFSFSSAPESTPPSSPPSQVRPRPSRPSHGLVTSLSCHVPVPVLVRVRGCLPGSVRPRVSRSRSCRFQLCGPVYRVSLCLCSRMAKGGGGG